MLRNLSAYRRPPFEKLAHAGRKSLLVLLVLPALVVPAGQENKSGAPVFALPAKELANVAFDSLRDTYVLWFRPAPGAKREFRTLTVRLAPAAASAHPGAVLCFRKGFYYQPPF